MSELVHTTIAGLGELFDGPHATPARCAEGPYFLNIASLKSGRLDLSASDHVSDEDFRRWTKRVTPRGDDLLFSYETRLGEAALMPRGVRACLGRRMALLRCDPSVVDAKFLLYYYLSPSFQRTIAKHTVHGATVPRIGLASMGSWEVQIPKLAEQRAIAEVLGALDDKIADNDGLISLTDDLLAAQFRQLALGRSRTSLSTLAQVNASSTKPVEGGSLRYIDIASVQPGSYEYPSLMPWSEAPGRARRVVRKGDTIWSTVRPNRRSHALVLDDDPLLIASTGLAVLTARTGRAAGLYESTRRPEFEAYLLSVAEGSAYPAVKAAHFNEAPVPELADADWDSFESVAFPLRERAHAAAVENRRLAETLDALLPVLMSGKVRVRDAVSGVSGTEPEEAGR